MKNLFIIDTYPSTTEQKKILGECVNRLKNIDFDILIISHIPIPIEIQNLVDYIVYDEDNSFLDYSQTAFSWVTLSDYNFTIKDNGHSLSITRNMQNAFKFAKTLGYEFFYFLEYDILFEPSDIEKLLHLKNEMINNSKKLIFFEPENFYECGSHVYETLLFGGYVDYFLSKLVPPKNMIEWNNLNMGYTLELAFYEKFSEYSENYLIIPEHSSSYFKDSKVNIFRYGLTIFELFYNYNNPSTPILLLYNPPNNNQNYFIKVFQNDILINQSIFNSGYWWFNFFEIDESELKLEIYSNEELLEVKKYKLSIETLEKLKPKAHVKLIN